MFDYDIFCQGLESLSVWLDHGDGYMTSFAGVDVFYGAFLAFVGAANDFALGTVLEFVWLFGFHNGFGVATRHMLLCTQRFRSTSRSNWPTVDIAGFVAAGLSGRWFISLFR